MMHYLTSAVRWLAACALVASMMQPTFAQSATVDRPVFAESATVDKPTFAQSATVDRPAFAESATVDKPAFAQSATGDTAAAAQQRSQEPRPAPAPREDTGETPDPQAKPGQQAPQPRQPGQAPRPTPAQPSLIEPVGRPVNLQIEVSISDQTGTGPGQKKTVSMIVADRALGRIRAASPPQFQPGFAPVQLRLNIDALPRLQANDTIRLNLTLEYEAVPASASSGSPSTETPQRPSPLNESLTVILQSGKPLTISRSADPIADRRVTVDVTATILK